MQKEIEQIDLYWSHTVKYPRIANNKLMDQIEQKASLALMAEMRKRGFIKTLVDNSKEKELNIKYTLKFNHVEVKNV